MEVREEGMKLQEETISFVLLDQNYVQHKNIDC